MSTMEEKAALDALLASSLPEEDYKIERLGITLRLRGMSHEEALALREFGRKDEVTTAQYEQRMLALTVLFPPMKPSDVKAWQKSSPAGEIDAVTRVIARLSGMLEDSAKEAYKSVSAEPGTGE